MRGYELMYILEPTLDEEATKALIGQIEEFMGKQGATVEATDPWGKRRLAYRIGKHLEGYYVLSRLKAEAKIVSELERRLRGTDGVLRFITVRADKEQGKKRRARGGGREGGDWGAVAPPPVGKESASITAGAKCVSFAPRRSITSTGRTRNSSLPSSRKERRSCRGGSRAPAPHTSES